MYKNLGVKRSDEDDAEMEEVKHELVLAKRTLEPYIEVVKRNTEIFTIADPDSIINEVGGFLQDEGHLVSLDAKKYKLKVTLKAEEVEEG